MSPLGALHILEEFCQIFGQKTASMFPHKTLIFHQLAMKLGTDVVFSTSNNVMLLE